MPDFQMYHEIIDTVSSHSRKYRTTTKNFVVHIYYNSQENINDLKVIIDEMNRTLIEIFTKILSEFDDDDKIRVSLKNIELEREIYTPFRKKSEFSVDLLINEIIKVSQSKKEFLLKGLIELNIISVKVPRIGGPCRTSFIDIDRWRKNSNRVVRVKGDGLCLARAIVVSIAYANKGTGKEEDLKWRRIREDTSKIQTKLALNLCSKANISTNLNGFDFNDFEKFQSVLDNYQLICVSPPKNIIYKGNINKNKQIYVQIVRSHADSLLSIRAFLNCNYFCKKCLVGFKNITSHRCIHRCKYCFSDENCQPVQNIDCNSCNRYFISELCFQNHLNKKICQNYRYCNKCKKLYTNKKHQCNMKKCNICCKIVPIYFHECYMKPNNKNYIYEQDSLPKIFIFYDFESFIELNENEEKIHKANLCCSSIVCDYCWDTCHKIKKYKFCNFCTAEEKSFTGYDAVKLFLNYIFNELNPKIQMNKERIQKKDKIKFKIIAHNSKSYDIHFIIKYCLENNFYPTHVIKKGSKILSMNIKHFQFIDSLSFLPMALSKLPKTFGFINEKKGIFPHLFNKPENWNIVQNNLPDIEYYQINTMKSLDRNDFINWYSENKNNHFNFQMELEKYCQNDVNILLKSFMLFRDNWIKIFSIDCTTRCITLAQAVMEVFKTNYLKEYQLAIIPNKGYSSKRKHSYISKAWLNFMQTQRNMNILHECKVLNYVADGFIPETGEIFEFYGCIFHGCLKCFPSKRFHTFNPINGISMENLYTNTMRREAQMKKAGFKLITIWECELNLLRKSSKIIENFFNNHLRNYKSISNNPELNPRDAFYGGRTNSLKLYHEIEENEKIYYYDFTSLYPYICKYGEFPSGHPQIIKEFNNTIIDDYNGLIYCVVLPPTNLFIPILPIRINGKLFFPLCYSCASNTSYNCNHSIDERAIIGCWVSIELKKAIEYGYKILRIFEVWHFKQIEKLNDSKHGLFDQFINLCIKGKIEASGWPHNNMTETEKIDYINSYLKRENILLDYGNIIDNPGKRNTFKLVVNTFWGKMGQNAEKMLKTEYIKSPEYFFKLLSDDTINVHDAYLVSDEVIHVKYNKKTPFSQQSNSSNVIIAAYVTAQARLHLYETLKILQKRCLYFDTDSVIFTAKNNEYIPETGIFLGELTNEISTNEEPNSYITKFISCGPKNYGIEIYRPNTNKYDYLIKVKGLSLNFETDSLINFNSMRDLINKSIIDDPVLLNIPQTIFRTSNFNEIQTKNTYKIYQLVYDKRMLNSDYTTLPFGYKCGKSFNSP